VTAVKILEESLAVGNVCVRLPLGFIVTDPLNQVLQLATADSRVKNGFDFVLIITLDLNGRWGWKDTTLDLVGMVGLQ
jgi:hypothetical protein